MGLGLVTLTSVTPGSTRLRIQYDERNCDGSYTSTWGRGRRISTNKSNKNSKGIELSCFITELTFCTQDPLSLGHTTKVPSVNEWVLPQQNTEPQSRTRVLRTSPSPPGPSLETYPPKHLQRERRRVTTSLHPLCT